MRRRLRDTPLSLRLTALYAAILAAVLTALGVAIFAQVERFVIDDTARRLEEGARPAIGRAFNPGPRRGGGPGPDLGRSAGSPALDELARELSSTGTAARVIAPDGTILAGARLLPEQP